jgi:hypothetical protein
VGSATTTIERRAVAHLPIPEAIDRLEEELPERVAGHVRAFYAEGYHSSQSSAKPKVRRIRRILRILTTEAATTNVAPIRGRGTTFYAEGGA